MGGILFGVALASVLLSNYAEYNKGYSRGKQDGYYEGLEKGREQGYLQGAIEMQELLEDDTCLSSSKKNALEILLDKHRQEISQQ